MNDPSTLPADPFLSITLLAQWLALTPRATALHTGATESVTDHTVHLAWLAIALCPPHLDRGKVAIYALVHDLVEAVTGDVNTLTATARQRDAKDDAEVFALAALRGRIPFHLLCAVTSYEDQRDPEARFVKILDKMAPILSHILNLAHLATLTTPAALAAFLADQEARLSAAYPDQPEALAVYRQSSAALLAALTP